MKNERPDGQSVRALLEAALAQSIGAHGPPAAAAASADVGVPNAPAPSSSGSPVVVGEVVDTHHPHLPGRVLVRWWPSAERECTEWLHHERHLTLLRGDRVLVTLPLGWAEWLITGALGRGVSASPQSAAADTAQEPAPGSEASPAQAERATLQLGPGQALVVLGHDGEPLVQLRQGPDGLSVELARDQVELKARRRLRLSADSIELAAGPGGVDVRTEGEAVTRARTIRLN